MFALRRSAWLVPLAFALACGGGEVAPATVIAPPPPPPVVVAPPPVEVPAPAAAEGSATEAEPKAAAPSSTKTASTAKTASRTPPPEVDLLAEDPAPTGSGSRPTDAAEEDELLLEDLDAPPPPVTKPRGSGVTKTRPK